MTQHVTDDNFASEILNYKGLAVVDLYADWCGPCKMMAPLIDELAAKHKGKVKIVKLNVDDSGKTAGQFGVTSIPTLIFFKDGKEADRLAGFQSQEVLEKKISEHA